MVQPETPEEVERQLLQLMERNEDAACEDVFHPARWQRRRDTNRRLLENAVVSQRALLARWYESHGIDAPVATTPGAAPSREQDHQAQRQAPPQERTLADVAATASALDVGFDDDGDAAVDDAGYFDLSSSAGGSVGDERDLDVENTQADIGGTAASSAAALSQTAANALMTARRAAAKQQASEVRSGGGIMSPTPVSEPRLPAAMTYNEFMASGAQRVLRRGEGVAGGITAEEEERLTAEGYVMSGRRNAGAQKRLEATQRAMHHAQAERRRLELVAEEHRRRNEDSLETYRRMLKQPVPLASPLQPQPPAAGGAGS
jgi:hypothetical protein